MKSDDIPPWRKLAWFVSLTIAGAVALALIAALIWMWLS